MKTNIHAQSGKFKAIILAALVAAITPASAVVTQSLIQKTGAVLPISTSPKIALGAKWTDFGRPSLTDYGQNLGYLGSYYGFGFKGTAIFHGPYSAPNVFVKIGDFSSDKTGASTSTSPKFTEFKDPVFGNEQFWAVRAKDTSGASGIWAGHADKHRLIAQVGAVVPNPTMDSRLPAGSTFIQLGQLQQVPERTLYFTATVKVSGIARKSLWRYRSTLPGSYVNGADAHLVLIEGETRTPYGTVTGPVSNILALGAQTDKTSSHGRMDAITGEIPIRYTCLFAGKLHQVVATVDTAGNVTTQLASKLAPGLPFGLPNFGTVFSGADLPANPGNIVTGVTLTPDTGLGITPPDALRMLDTNVPLFKAVRNAFSPDSVGIALGPQKYSSFFSPVCGYANGFTTDVSLSFVAGLQNLASASVFSNFGPLYPTVCKVADRTDVATGTSGTYASFDYLSHMHGKGPLVDGKFRVTTPPFIRHGLWGGDPSTGLLVNLIKEGDNIGGIVQSFECLAPVNGSIGQRRVWVYSISPVASPERPVTMKVTFQTGERGIVVVKY